MSPLDSSAEQAYPYGTGRCYSALTPSDCQPLHSPPSCLEHPRAAPALGLVNARPPPAPRRPRPAPAHCGLCVRLPCSAHGRPRQAHLLLRLLPEALTAELDPRTLHRLPAAHVGPGLRRRWADMPWRIACRPTAGRPPRPPVLLAIEFQATVDCHMALRVETCTTLLRQDLLREGHLAGPNRELPRVLPVVVHTGRHADADRAGTGGPRAPATGRCLRTA